MGNCRDTNLKYNCGDRRQNARCVLYEGYIPNYSKLLDEDCITLEETTEELYKNQEEILKSIDTSKLGKKCLDYSFFQEDDKLKVKDVLLTFEKEICELKGEDTNCCNSNDNGLINLSKLDYKCLDIENSCNSNITITKLIQSMIDKICNLEDRIKILES